MLSSKSPISLFSSLFESYTYLKFDNEIEEIHFVTCAHDFAYMYHSHFIVSLERRKKNMALKVFATDGQHCETLKITQSNHAYFTCSSPNCVFPGESTSEYPSHFQFHLNIHKFALHHTCL